MNEFILYMLIGFASGIIIFPIILYIFNTFRNTKERRKIKKLMKQGKILTPIDPKDYDVEAWKGKKFGNIDIEAQKVYLDRLNEKIFKKSIESSDDSFFVRINDYIKEARKIGYSDKQIKEEFKKKSYTDELIEKIFENEKEVNR